MTDHVSDDPAVGSPTLGQSPDDRLTEGELLELRRWNTPTVCNGWEQITSSDIGRDCFNLEPVTDYMPHMGSMVGYAITLVIQPGESAHPGKCPDGWLDYWRYVSTMPGPKIVVVQDLDKPRTYGSAWGEVNASIHRALGCVGVIVDGAIRDTDEMNAVGFKALARLQCVSHAHAHPVRWGCDVDVFGRRVSTGQLIHADQHGFLAVPKKDEKKLLEATRVMDSLETKYLISSGRDCAGKSMETIAQQITKAAKEMDVAIRQYFGGS